MKKFKQLAVAAMAALAVSSAWAATPASQPLSKDQLLGYGIGVSIAQSISQRHVAGDKSMMAQGFKDALLGKKLLVSSDKLKQALIAYSKEMRQKQQEQIHNALAKNQQTLVHSHSPVAGNPNGRVTLVEFYDYQCVHCRHMAPVIEKLIKLDPQLRVVFKQFPIFGKDSVYAAKAVLAAQKQGKFWQLHNALLSSKSQLKPQEVLNIAQRVGLNLTQLKKDMNNPEYTKQLLANTKLAESIGVMGTPGFVVMQTKVSSSRFSHHAKPILIPGAVGIKQLAKAVQSVQHHVSGQASFAFPSKQLNVKPISPDVWRGI